LHCEITVLSWEKSMEMDTFIFAVLQKIISIWILLTLYSDRVGTKQSAISSTVSRDFLADHTNNQSYKGDRYYYES